MGFVLNRSLGIFDSIRGVNIFEDYFEVFGHTYQRLHPLKRIGKSPVILIEAREKPSSWERYLLTALKALSYFTIIIPLVMLSFKLYHRNGLDYRVQKKDLSMTGQKETKVGFNDQNSFRFFHKNDEPEKLIKPRSSNLLDRFNWFYRVD